MPASMRARSPRAVRARRSGDARCWREWVVQSLSMLAALRRGLLQSTVAAGGAVVVVAAVRGLGNGRREDGDEGSPGAKSDTDWASTLTREQFHVLRMGGTEHPFSGEYVQFSPAGGHFACAGCALPLYSAGAAGLGHRFAAAWVRVRAAFGDG